MEILFKGPLNNTNDPFKCNYIIYWCGEIGMGLVDKWEIKGKIHDGNKNQINRYFELFEEHIAPKSNTLIAIVELKRLFQSSMNLEDFHTKALRLVKEAEYPEGDIWNRVLTDTIISGLASDKIHAKVIKEGKDVTLPRVMEIARLEVSTQRHIDRMQETAKVNYIQYGKGSKKGKAKSSGKGSPNGGGCGGAGKPSKPSGKGKQVPLPTDICWRCGKGRHQEEQPCKAVEAVCRNCSIKGHYEKVCMKRKSTHLGNVPKASTSSTNSEPDYFNEHGDPVYAHMVNVNEIHWKKHLIQFPISVDLEKVRNSMECSTRCPTVLLKADTGADMNLMNLNTFDTLIKDRTILQPSSLRMEAYESGAVEVLGKFHVFLRWKGCVYRQLFYVTNANDSPNLLSWDGCYTLGVIRPCYSVETTENASEF